MKKIFSFMALSFSIITVSLGQEGKKDLEIPAIVKSAFSKKYPTVSKVIWETEKGNYEANWGGKSGEDNSATFSPSGNFVQIEKSIPASSLPKSVDTFISKNYKNTKISEAGKVTDSEGIQTFEITIKGRDLIFDVNGKFLKKD